MWRVDQEHCGARGNGCFERIDVNTKVGRTKRDGYAHTSRHGDARGVRVVVRLKGDDFVTFINQRQDRAGKRLRGTGSDQDFSVGINDVVVPTHLMPSHGLAKFGDPNAWWVLVSFSSAQCLNGGFANGFWTIGVRKSLA